MSLKADVYSLLDNAMVLCDGCDGTIQLKEEISQLKKRLDMPLRVAVVGAMKAGKSTFLNALMGADILYTGSLETTYTVGWFKYAKKPSIEIHFRDGSSQKEPFEDLEKWSVRKYADTNLRINEVKYLIIYYPSEVLKKLEFIDTPGLNSAYGTDAQNTLDFLAIKSSEETLYEASNADAVLYAFNRSPSGMDHDILSSFHSGSSMGASPINSIGILTKVDGTGIWDVFEEKTPVEAAEPIVAKNMQNEQIKKVLFTIFPVCAKVVEGYAMLNSEEWDTLKKLSEYDMEDLQDMIYDARNFCISDEEEFVNAGRCEVRESLLSKIGQYGVYEISRQLASGISEKEIEQVLQEKCGIAAIREMLLTHFGNRTFLIKTRYIFNQIQSIIQKIRKESQGNMRLLSICSEIKESMNDLMSSVQSLKELKVLQMYYNGQISFMNQEEEADFLRITGEYGRAVETRLGIKQGHSVAELEVLAKKKMQLWNQKANGFMMSSAYVEAAVTVARSLEQIYYHLNMLNEE